MKNKKMKQRFYSATDIATYLGVDRRSLIRWRNDKNPIPHRIINNRAYYDIDEVNEWLEERPARKWKSKHPSEYSELETACKKEMAYDREIVWSEIVDKVRCEQDVRIPMKYVNGLKRVIEDANPTFKFKTNKEE